MDFSTRPPSWHAPCSESVSLSCVCLVSLWLLNSGLDLLSFLSLWCKLSLRDTLYHAPSVLCSTYSAFDSFLFQLKLFFSCASFFSSIIVGMMRLQRFNRTIDKPLLEYLQAYKPGKTAPRGGIQSRGVSANDTGRVRRGNMSVMSLADGNLLSTCPLLMLPACSCSQMCLQCQLSLCACTCTNSSKETPEERHTTVFSCSNLRLNK